MAKQKALKIETVAIDSLTLDPHNARKHPSINLEYIKRSLTKFGQQKPIVVSKENIVIAGNGTVAAALELGWKEISIVRSELTGEDATAFGITDNQTALSSLWEYEQLGSLIADLESVEYDLDVLGFGEDELTTILAADWTPPELTDLEEQHDASNAKPIIVTPAQRETIDHAINRVREMNDDNTLTEGRCLELMCGDWLSGQ